MHKLFFLILCCLPVFSQAQILKVDSIALIEEAFVKDSIQMEKYVALQMDLATSGITDLARASGKARRTSIYKNLVARVPLIKSYTALKVETVTTKTLLGKLDTLSNVFTLLKRESLIKKELKKARQVLEILRRNMQATERSPSFINILRKASSIAKKDFLQLYYDAKTKEEKQSILNEIDQIVAQ